MIALRPSLRVRPSQWILLLIVAGLSSAACDTALLYIDHDAHQDGGTSDGADAHLDIQAFDVPVMMDTGAMCSNETDCTGNPAGPHCDLNTQMCRPCLANPNTCPTGMFCDATFTCVHGCDTDLDCAPADAGATDAGVTDHRCDVAHHTCVQCLGDLDCPSDLVCRSNQCRVGCSSMRPCPGSLSCCDGACTDLLDTADHCGACNHACDTGDTCCGGICYGLQTDPRHCGGCMSRCSLTNATASCAMGACTVGTCTPGFGDCDGDATNGCETNLGNDPTHCGTCAMACTSGAHVVSTCDTGVCHSTCAPGFLHCSSDPTSGCETNPTNDPANCGVCGNVCSGAHVATGGCSSGACTVVACSPGYTDCDGAANNGCEANTATDVLDCGACFHVCPTGPYSMPTCAAGTCGVSCLAGHGDCDGNATNGCEADFDTDPNHCGGCATTCSMPANATRVCTTGTCGFYCNGTFQDCDAVAANGCEANLISDVSNCGACHNACVAPHASVTCNTGACGIASCASGFANCNGAFSDGCETPTVSDPLNCGGCNVNCSSPPFATGVCTSSACGFTCIAGHADCDGVAGNGCEVALGTSIANCGTCGHACITPANSAPTCTTGSCGFTCLAGFADCNGLAIDGCEVNLSSSFGNCGACGNVCSFPNSTGACTAGACMIAACDAGFQNCDGVISNGCETNIASDLNNCGSCLNVCPLGGHATATCTAGTCGDICAPGYGNCNGNPIDGCEVTLATSPTNCGSCGNACATPPNTIATCAASTCGFTCLPGFRDCNGLPGDGCEVNISTSASNCGACGAVCSAPNAAPACSAGGCTIGTCNAGFRDCNGIYGDGCEVNVTANSSNCGACGNICTGGTICQSSTCTLVNPFPSTGVNGAFAPVVNTTLPAGLYNYTTINIPVGVTVTVSGNGILDLRATGAVTIAGTINVSGGAGGNGVRPAPGGGGGGNTAQQITAASGPVGTPGGGGSGPVGQNAAGCGTNGLGGTNGGGSGALGVTTVGGGGGGGPAGGAGGLLFGACVAGSGGGGATAGAGGQAGGAPYDGAPGQSGFDPCGALVAGGGGGSIGTSAAGDLPVSTTFVTGSAGGGGSGAYSVGLSAAEGGGGGGGGALRISSSVSITITATGVIRADGGAGGAGSDANSICALFEGGAGGGGGSGGTIYFAAPTLSVTGGFVSAVGGLGGHSGANVSGGYGGNGGTGRIRITTNTASCSLGGTFNPAPRSACNANAMPGFVYIAGYPF